jgi:RsiW-degrading membrane proteinase PrsW (M82 family)
MNGLWVLLLLILIAALPVLPVWVWLRARKFPRSPQWFLLSLLAGALALLIAALLQFCSLHVFPDLDQATGPGRFFNTIVTVFIRIALTEEAGRILALGLFFRFRPYQMAAESATAYSAATGLLAGLGFAIIESASYGAADMSIALFRSFTAAPLHGACGARIGMGVMTFRERPGQGILRVFSAVAIHGMYNLMVLSPGIPRAFPVLIAFSALASSVQVIRSGLSAEK